MSALVAVGAACLPQQSRDRAPCLRLREQYHCRAITRAAASLSDRESRTNLKPPLPAPRTAAPLRAATLIPNSSKNHLIFRIKSILTRLVNQIKSILTRLVPFVCAINTTAGLPVTGKIRPSQARPPLRAAPRITAPLSLGARGLRAVMVTLIPIKKVLNLNIESILTRLAKKMLKEARVSPTQIQIQVFTTGKFKSLQLAMAP